MNSLLLRGPAALSKHRQSGRYPLSSLQLRHLPTIHRRTFAANPLNAILPLDETLADALEQIKEKDPPGSKFNLSRIRYDDIIEAKRDRFRAELVHFRDRFDAPIYKAFKQFIENKENERIAAQKAKRDGQRKRKQEARRMAIDRGEHVPQASKGAQKELERWTTYMHDISSIMGIDPLSDVEQIYPALELEWLKGVFRSEKRQLDPSLIRGDYGQHKVRTDETKWARWYQMEGIADYIDVPPNLFDPIPVDTRVSNPSNAYDEGDAFDFDEDVDAAPEETGTDKMKELSERLGKRIARTARASKEEGALEEKAQENNPDEATTPSLADNSKQDESAADNLSRDNVFTVLDSLEVLIMRQIESERKFAEDAKARRSQSVAQGKRGDQEDTRAESDLTLKEQKRYDMSAIEGANNYIPFPVHRAEVEDLHEELKMDRGKDNEAREEEEDMMGEEDEDARKDMRELDTRHEERFKKIEAELGLGPDDPPISEMELGGVLDEIDAMDNDEMEATQKGKEGGAMDLANDKPDLNPDISAEHLQMFADLYHPDHISGYFEDLDIETATPSQVYQRFNMAYENFKARLFGKEIGDVTKQILKQEGINLIPDAFEIEDNVSDLARVDSNHPQKIFPRDDDLIRIVRAQLFHAGLVDVGYVSPVTSENPAAVNSPTTASTRNTNVNATPSTSPSFTTTATTSASSTATPSSSQSPPKVAANVEGSTEDDSRLEEDAKLVDEEERKDDEAIEAFMNLPAPDLSIYEKLKQKWTPENIQVVQKLVDVETVPVTRVKRAKFLPPKSYDLPNASNVEEKPPTLPLLAQMSGNIIEQQQKTRDYMNKREMIEAMDESVELESIERMTVRELDEMKAEEREEAEVKEINLRSNRHYLEQEVGGGKMMTEDYVRSMYRADVWYPRNHIHHNYPIEFITKDFPFQKGHETSKARKDYIYRYRKVIMRVNMAVFDLPHPVMTRFKGLVGKRYDEHSGILTLVAETMPSREHNMFLIRQIFKDILHESWMVDPNYITDPVPVQTIDPKQRFVPSEEAIASESSKRLNIFRLQGYPVIQDNHNLVKYAQSKLQPFLRTQEQQQ